MMGRPARVRRSKPASKGISCICTLRRFRPLPATSTESLPWTTTTRTMRLLVSQTAGPSSAKRQGLYIEVANGLAQARVVPVAEGESDVDLQAIAPTTAAAAQGRFLAMLTDYGLTSEEAAGLADVWKPQFWQTPGKRLLVILAAKDYDAMCPLRVRPKPTEVVRLGVLLTEF